MKQTDSGIWVPDTPTIFVKPTEEIISQRKMEGMQSLSTSCLCNKYCKNRSNNSELVCSHCYAQRQMKMYKNLNACLERNTEILTGRILKEAENRKDYNYEELSNQFNDEIEKVYSEIN